MILLITYEIADPFRDLSGLYSTLKSTDAWWHHIANVWVIDTEKNADEWYDLLIPYFVDQDNLFIVEITEEHQGWLPEKAWLWLEKRNFKELPLFKKDSEN